MRQPLPQSFQDALNRVFDFRTNAGSEGPMETATLAIVMAFEALPLQALSVGRLARIGGALLDGYVDERTVQAVATAMVKVGALRSRVSTERLYELNAQG